MIKIDKDRCSGCGTCIWNCPQNFDRDLIGLAKVIDQKDYGNIEDAVLNCPTQAISIEINDKKTKKRNTPKRSDSA